MRGRNNNNSRKGPNPLARNYESNGPDVKIRGSAQQIAEKYAALARDAQSAGDRVIAENYLRHAEHYYRIIAAAQAQMPAQQQIRDNRDDVDEDGDDELYIQPDVRSLQPMVQPIDGSGPQPIIEGLPAEVALKHDPAEVNGNRDPNANMFQPAAAAAAAEGEEEEASQRRPARRTRRPRSRPEPVGQASGGSDGESKGDAGGSEVSGREIPDPAAA